MFRILTCQSLRRMTPGSREQLHWCGHGPFSRAGANMDEQLVVGRWRPRVPRHCAAWVIAF